MNESTQQIIEEGQEARELLANPAFNRLFTELRDSYYNQWLVATSTEQREQLHAATKGLSDMMATLEASVNIADYYIEQQVEQTEEDDNNDY